MIKRTANSQWDGGLTDGKGHMRFGSGAFDGQYSFSSRFENGTGTNPEELIGAAHSGCFSMAFAAGLGKAGFSPKSVKTTATVHMDKVDGGFKIVEVILDTEADVPGIDEKTFQEIAEGSKKGCPISQALAAIPKITLHAKLLQTA